MALQDKDILITPNRGQSSDPKIEFKAADATIGPKTITLNVYPASNGTLSFEGSAGQLFSITNELTGTIFSVNDISGIPSIEVQDTGLVKIAQYSGNVLLGTGVDNAIDKLQVNGSITASQSIKSSLFIGPVQGNASTATTANNLTGFTNGNSNTPIPGPDAQTGNGIGYVQSISLLGQTDGALYSQAYSTNWVHQIYGDYRTGQIALRGKNNGTWQSWRTVIDTSNYNTYVPTLTGGGASGTWGISITGSSGNSELLGGRDSTHYLYGQNQSGSNTASTTQNSYELAQYKSGFWDVNGASWTPNTEWWWGATFAHTSNSSSYNYSGQLAFKNGGGGDEVYARTISGAVPSQWSRLLSNTNYNSYAPTLTGGGASGTWGISITGSAATLTTARTINGTSFNGSANITTANWGTARTLSFTGDVTGSSSVNGSANVATAMTLANSGVTAGTYGSATTVPVITVDAKGRITSASTATVTATDNTKLPLAGGTMTGAITFAAGQTWPTFNQNTTGSAATLTTGRTIGMTGDVTWTSAAFNGSANVTGTATLANSGVTAGTYGSATTVPVITVDAKGRITSASTATVTATDSTKLPLAGGTMTGNLSIISGTLERTITLGSSGAYLYGNATTYGVFKSGGGSLSFNVTSGDLTSSGNVTAYSDIRLKSDLEVIQDAMSKVKQLTGYTYTRKDTGIRQTGLVAQDVQKVLPEAVANDGNHLSLAYGNLVGLLVEAIKEQQAQIDKLTHLVMKG